MLRLPCGGVVGLVVTGCVSSRVNPTAHAVLSGLPFERLLWLLDRFFLHPSLCLSLRLGGSSFLFLLFFVVRGVCKDVCTDGLMRTRTNARCRANDRILL